jgi:MinD-like ATPase involved in chromosome partitioning or flagellar assembly
MYLGHVERDPHLIRAVRSQLLVTHSFPSAPSSRCFRQLAQALVLQSEAGSLSDSFVWDKLLNHWIN